MQIMQSMKLFIVKYNYAALEFLIISTLPGKGTSFPLSTVRFWTSQSTNLLHTQSKLPTTFSDTQF